MIDKNGKLFGIVNVIDLFIVLAVIMASVFVTQKIFRKTEVLESNKKYKVTFFQEEMPEYIYNAIKIGDNVEDEAKFISLGKVVSLDKKQGYVYNPNSQGQVTKSYKEGYVSPMIVSEVLAEEIQNGIQISGNKYNVGHGLIIRIGASKYYYRIYDISKVEG